MKISLSNGVCCGTSWLDSSNFAVPGRKGLYGKKPAAKMRMAIGISRFDRSRRKLNVVPAIFVTQPEDEMKMKTTTVMIYRADAVAPCSGSMRAASR